VNVYTIYVGDDEVTYSRFKEYLDGTLAYAVNFEEAVDLIADNCGDKSLMVFYEKRESFEIESHAMNFLKVNFLKHTWCWYTIILIRENCCNIINSDK
jgi:hypothetical protein